MHNCDNTMNWFNNWETFALWINIICQTILTTRPTGQSCAFGVCGSAVWFDKLLPGQSHYNNNLFLGQAYSNNSLRSSTLYWKGKKWHCFHHRNNWKWLQMPRPATGSSSIFYRAAWSPMNDWCEIERTHCVCVAASSYSTYRD